MRLLHTADWHLGQHLHQYERTQEHAAFLAWLLDTLEAEAVDALLIAGDVFDTANPSAQAQAQLYRFLVEARRRLPHLSVAMIAGNHDSAARLEAPAALLDLCATRVAGHLPRCDGAFEPGRLVWPLSDRCGSVRAWCIAMPFLRPGDVAGPCAQGEDAYLAGLHSLHRQVLEVALARRQPGQAIVAMGHCHLQGGQVSEGSERPIVIGGAQAWPAGLFDPAIAYVALGHLHRAQTVGGQPSRRYSGSPLPMSFAELHYPHQVLRVDLEGEALAQVQALPVPRPVDFLRVPERPAPLADVLAALAGLNVPQRPESQWPYLQVRVRLFAPEPGLRAQLEAALAGKPVRLARIELSRPDPVAAATAPASLDELHALDPLHFFERLYRHRYGGPPPPALLGAFAELVAGTEDGR